MYLFFTGETTGNLRISDACNALISCHQLYQFTEYIVDPKSRSALRYLTMYIQIGKKSFPSKTNFVLFNCGHQFGLRSCWVQLILLYQVWYCVMHGLCGFWSRSSDVGEQKCQSMMINDHYRNSFPKSNSFKISWQICR